MDTQGTEPLVSETPDPAADLELAQRILGGDRGAFEQFIQEALPVVQRFAAARLASDPDRIRDVVQSTICKAIENLAAFRGEGSLLSWVCGICRFEVLTVYKGRRREPVQATELEGGELESALSRDRQDASPERDLLEQEERSLVHLALEHVAPHYAEVLEAKYTRGEPVSTIAQRLGVSEKTVESRLTRARGAFRGAYEDLVRRLGPRGAPGGTESGMT